MGTRSGVLLKIGPRTSGAMAESKVSWPQGHIQTVTACDLIV